MLLSVIIPAFNAENSIRKTLDSVIKNLCNVSGEVIVVNDGSTDKTESILKEYSEKCGKLRYITRKNSGPSKSRDAGIKEAKGEYIIFSDSDDYFADDSFGKIVAELLEKKPDFFIFGFEIIDKDGSCEKYRAEKKFYETSDEFKKDAHILYSLNMLNQVWGKVFKKSIITENEVLFPEYRWGEDRLFVFDYIKNSKTFFVTDECFYKYVMTEGSLITSFVSDKFKICTEIDSKSRLLSSVPISKEAKRVYDYMYVKSVISCYTMLFSKKCGLSLKEKREYVKKTLECTSLTSEKIYPENCGFSFKMLSKIISSQNVTLILLSAKLIWFVSENASSFFRHAKHKINKENENEKNH